MQHEHNFRSPKTFIGKQDLLEDDKGRGIKSCNDGVTSTLDALDNDRSLKAKTHSVIFDIIVEYDKVWDKDSSYQ